MAIVLHTEQGRKRVSRDVCERIEDSEKRARCLELYDEIEWGTKFEIVMFVIGVAIFVGVAILWMLGLI